MADISITAGSVLKGANAKTWYGKCAETITAGQSVYESSSGVWSKADANVAACSTARIGVALNGGSVNQPLEIDYDDDDFTPGGTLSLSVAGVASVIVVSATAGGVAPVTDLAATMYPLVLGVSKSTSKMILKTIQGTGVLTA